MGKCPGRGDFWTSCSLDHPNGSDTVPNWLECGKVEVASNYTKEIIT